MLKSIVFAISFAAAVTFTPAWAAESTAASPAAAPKPTPDEIVTQFRNDLQAVRADVVAKQITLTADQASKFWPLFNQFQSEQNAIIDAQLKATQAYSASYSKLTDADSVAYVSALLERDAKIQALRASWLTKFQSVVPAGTAARVIQIDRRLGLVAQLKLSSQIPLVH